MALNSAAHIEQVLFDPATYAKAPLTKPLRWLVGDGTSLSDYGDRWSLWNQLRPAKRRSIGPGLSLLPEEVLIALWYEDVSALPPVVDAYKLCYRMFFKASWQCLFKDVFEDEAKRAADDLRETARAASLAVAWRSYDSYSDRSLLAPKEGVWAKRGRYSDQLLQRQRAIDSLLNRAEERAETDSVVTFLRDWVGVQRVLPAEGNRVLRFALVGTLLASFENSASLAAWLLWLLAAHSEWQERIVSGDEAALQWCLNETLRLYPPVWSLVRQANAPTSLDEHQLAQGTFVWMSPWVQGRQRAFWERAHEFAPQRWERAEVPPGQFLPFGLGSRSCPGEASARSHLATWIRLVLRSYRLSRVDNAAEPHPLIGVTLRPEGEVWVRFTLRAQPR